MKPQRNCLARQYSDQMMCAACGLAWDINDPDPPACRKVDRRSKIVKEIKTFEAPPSKPKKLPDQLPADVAIDMVKAYLANGQSINGMQAAYRVFLDRTEL